jgi:hypothetical protein
MKFKRNVFVSILLFGFVSVITSAEQNVKNSSESKRTPDCISDEKSVDGKLTRSDCVQTTANANKEKAAQTVSVPDKQILFFLNPNGRPCQIQSTILDNMKSKLASKASVKYISTTEKADLEKFGRYGIRALPMLIIEDKNGKEVKRFTPGIQEEQAILSALESK